MLLLLYIQKLTIIMYVNKPIAAKTAYAKKIIYVWKSWGLERGKIVLEDATACNGNRSWGSLNPDQSQNEQCYGSLWENVNSKHVYWSNCGIKWNQSKSKQATVELQPSQWNLI